MISIFGTKQSFNFIIREKSFTQILGAGIDTAVIGRIFLIQTGRWGYFTKTLTILHITIPQIQNLGQGRLFVVLRNIGLKVLLNLFNGFFTVLGNEIFKTVAGLFIHDQAITAIQLHLTVDFGILLAGAGKKSIVLGTDIQGVCFCI
uniref:Transmembrane protein n=1 Tax=Acinetobacter schindleri TaxID=108981 RepID=A9Y1U6_9GAMM|nr:transmembrane protein [Acinetobacter schindleri]